MGVLSDVDCVADRAHKEEPATVDSPDTPVGRDRICFYQNKYSQVVSDELQTVSTCYDEVDDFHEWNEENVAAVAFWDVIGYFLVAAELRVALNFGEHPNRNAVRDEGQEDQTQNHNHDRENCFVVSCQVNHNKGGSERNSEQEQKSLPVVQSRYIFHFFLGRWWSS